MSERCPRCNSEAVVGCETLTPGPPSYRQCASCGAEFTKTQWERLIDPLSELRVRDKTTTVYMTIDGEEHKSEKVAYYHALRCWFSKRIEEAGFYEDQQDLIQGFVDEVVIGRMDEWYPTLRLSQVKR